MSASRCHPTRDRLPVIRRVAGAYLWPMPASIRSTGASVASSWRIQPLDVRFHVIAERQPELRSGRDDARRPDQWRHGDEKLDDLVRRHAGAEGRRCRPAIGADRPIQREQRCESFRAPGCERRDDGVPHPGTLWRAVRPGSPGRAATVSGADPVETSCGDGLSGTFDSTPQPDALHHPYGMKRWAGAVDSSKPTCTARSIASLRDDASSLR